MTTAIEIEKRRPLQRSDADTPLLKHVLDHGYARLVSYMQPVPEEITETAGMNDYRKRLVQPLGWTGDLEIVRNARVSYNADWRTGDDAGKDEKLIRKMRAEWHSSPFEAMVFTFEIMAPIFVFRQWHRHRTWSYNEVSARYSELPGEYYVPAPEHIGIPHPNDKQARVFLSPVDGLPLEGFVGVNVDHVPDKDRFPEAYRMYMAAKQDRLSESIQAMCEAATQRYRDLLNAGVPRELARGVLPVNTYSRMFATVDLHNLMHFMSLRLDWHAQYEIRVYAKALRELIRPVCPFAVAAFESEGITEDAPSAKGP